MSKSGGTSFLGQSNASFRGCVSRSFFEVAFLGRVSRSRFEVAFQGLVGLISGTRFGCVVRVHYESAFQERV